LNGQVTELLENCGALAAIWFEGIAVPSTGATSRFRCQEFYDYIQGMQPQVLVFCKQGCSGTKTSRRPKKSADATGKPMEICTATCPGPKGKSVSWGCLDAARGNNLDADQVWGRLKTVGFRGCILLLNSESLSDGLIDSEYFPVLEDVGERI
jgi:hypothetical protein